MAQFHDSQLTNLKPMRNNSEQEYIKIVFYMLEKDWPYPPIEMIFSLNDPFLILEDVIKKEHGCIKNLQFYTDSALKNKIQYKFEQTIQSKSKWLNIFSDGKSPKMKLYYKYDNAYQWPLLSS